MLLKNKSYSNRLNASALFYALVISGIISVLCGILVSIAYFYKQQQIDQFEKESLIHNINSAIAIVLESDEEFLTEKRIELFDDEQDFVFINKYTWGLFSVANASAWVNLVTGSDTISKTLLIGANNGDYGDVALYLVDRGKPLVLVGDTKIKGKSYLPKAGAERGILAGKGFIGDQLIEGDKLKSSTWFPSLHKNKMEQLLQTLNNIQGNSLIESDIIHSFNKSTFEISDQNIYFDALNLKGNIVVKARETIFISANCKIEDVIMYAPKIIIEDGFQGNLQAFATSELVVGSNCKLNYPSVLGLLITDNSTETPKMEISVNTSIEGTILVYQQKRNRHLPKLSIDQKVLIKGQIIADAEVDFKGTIYGSAMVNKFSLKTSSSTHDNYLLDAIIDRSKMPDFFVGPVLYDHFKASDIAKWLY